MAYSSYETYIKHQAIITQWPISLLCVVSEVLKRLVYNDIVNFVSTSVRVQQFGFLHGRSTLQELLVMLDTVICSGSQTDLWLWIKAYLTG